MLCNRVLGFTDLCKPLDLIHELHALLIYSGVVDVDASIPGLRSVNKGDAKCKCATRNVIFVSDLIAFDDRKSSPPPTELNLKPKTAQHSTPRRGRSKIIICVVAQARDWRLFPALGQSYFDGERQQFSIIRWSGGRDCLVFHVQAQLARK